MTSMLPTLKMQAASLRLRLTEAEATLSMLRDMGLPARGHEHDTKYLRLRLEAIDTDIAMLESAYVNARR